jgi:hypothetical protein
MHPELELELSSAGVGVGVSVGVCVGCLYKAEDGDSVTVVKGSAASRGGEADIDMLTLLLGSGIGN